MSEASSGTTTRMEFEQDVRQALDTIDISALDALFTIACRLDPAGVATTSSILISIPPELPQQVVVFLCEALVVESKRIALQMIDTFCYEGPLQ